MPVAGRKPKEGPKRNTMPAAFDWIEVVNVPFRSRPLVGLPAKRRLVVEGRTVPEAWEPMTKTWWKAISTMPHCALWTLADWQFAVASAVVADNAFRGSTPAAGELRQREKIMGVTLDARRDLRIRYVPKLVEPKQAVVPSSVASIDERRRRSTGGDGAS